MANNSSLADELLAQRLLFATPYKISHQDQLALLDHVARDGAELPLEGDIPPHWVGMGLTLPQKKYLEKAPQAHLGWWTYLSRLDRSIEWDWVDHPASQIVQKILSPLLPYYVRFTRVSLIIQIPGRMIPAHRDIVVGDTYDNMRDHYMTLMGHERMLFKGKEWFEYNESRHGRDTHKSQFYLNLKIPLSTQAEEPGKPFVILNKKKISYSSHNHLFFLNEALIEHGAEPCAYPRGVVFVDGFFDLRKLHSLPQTPITVISTEPVDDMKKWSPY